MSDGILRFAPLDVDAVEVLLCDADGNPFGTEEPAFVASTKSRTGCPPSSEPIARSRQKSSGAGQWAGTSA